MPEDRRPILCVIHHEPEDPGLVGQLLSDAGRDLRVCQPNAGDALPDPETLAGAVIFGGTMSANDDHDPAIRAELDWIERALARETRLLGICLGGQMIARCLGAKIGPHPEGLWEIGYRKLVPTPAGAAFFAESASFFQWHREGFALPAGAERLAGGETYPNQAFRYGLHTVGLQFHPEVTAAQLASWHARFSADMETRPGGDPVTKQLADDATHRPDVARWLGRTLPDWIGT